MTKVDADFGGSPFYYAMLQALTQAIESVGSMDRTAIADYLRKNKFNTIVGEVSMPGRFFQAVAGVGFSDFAQVKLKTGWA